MAAGIINLQKASGGVTQISGIDGTGTTQVVVPESGTLASVDASVTDNSIARFDGTTGKLQDSGVTIDDSGNLLLTSGSGALGYGSGAGGTVTQLTSKNAAVSLHKPTGTITMHHQALAAGASAVFNFTNSMMDAFSLIKFQIIAGYSSYNSYKIESDDINGQLVRVKLTNVSAVSLSEAVILNFNIIKGANA